MKKDTEKTKAKKSARQTTQPVSLCLKSLNSYLNSYLSALETTSVHR